MINEDTRLIYSKYSFFLQVIFDDRLNLYNFLDIYHHEFFDDHDYIMILFSDIKTDWFKYKQKRMNLFKSFQKLKIKIQRRNYKEILYKYYCIDISEIIISFLL